MDLTLFGDSYVPDTPFASRQVCISGTFRQPLRTLQQRLKQLGAEIVPRPGRSVHYVLLGEQPSAEHANLLRSLAFNGFEPRTLRQAELDDILAGHYREYRVEAEIEKHLRLTIEHYEHLRVDFSRGLNPLYTRELYVSPHTLTPQSQLYQMLGDRGIYANPYIDDTTDVIVLGQAEMELLRQGQTDDVIEYIQQTYNQSRSLTFRYAMTSEPELLSFLKSGE